MDYNFLIQHFGVIATLLCILIVGVIGITFTVKFDLNKFLDSKKKTNRSRAQQFCPHMDFDISEDTRVRVNSWFESPTGTPQWICKVCGVVRNSISSAQIDKEAEAWISNYDKYLSQIKKYNKYAKKSL